MSINHIRGIIMKQLTQEQIEKRRATARESIRRMHKRNKHRAYELLGGKCCQCGFNDERALQIDHINGGGVKELKRYGNKTYYYSVVARSIQAGEHKYQLLCANCNWIKRHTHKEQ